MENSLFGHATFPRYFLGQLFSQLTYQMVVLAVGWQIYELTNSAMSLGLIGLVQFLPQVLLVLAAGHFADSHDRRRIVYLCTMTQGSMAAVLAAGSYAGWLNSEIIYVCAFLVGAARAFQSPATQSLLPQLVERGVLPTAIAYNSVVRNFSVIVGPALGGGIYLLGADAVYATSAIFGLIASFLFASIYLPFSAQSKEPATLKSVFAGIAYIRGKPDILGSISMDLFAMLLGGVTALLPIYARDILFVGPAGLGLLRAAPAAGALLMTAYLVRKPLTRQVGRAMFAGVTVFGVATIVFALSDSFMVSMIALMITGAGDMVSVVIRSSLVQLETPDQMRGRVSAVNSIFVGTSSQLGQFESGVVAALFGAVPSAVIGGIGTLLVVVLWRRMFPGLYNRDALVTPVEKAQ